MGDNREEKYQEIPKRVKKSAAMGSKSGFAIDFLKRLCYNVGGYISLTWSALNQFGVDGKFFGAAVAGRKS